MIQAIAFDLGGVLFAEGKSILIKKLSETPEYNIDSVLSVLKSPQSHDLRNGLITDNAFWQWAATQLPQGYNTEFIKTEWYDSYILDEDIKKLLTKLRNNYKLIAFSGNIKSRIEYLDQKYNFRKLFDTEIYSFDYHLSKYDKKFVEALIQKSGVKPEEIICIDDSEKDIFLASTYHINIIIYSRGQITQLLNDLNKLEVKV